MSLNLNITEDLLQYLDEVFPDRLPSKKTSERDIWIQMGQVEVVRFLKNMKEREEEEDVPL